MNKSIILGLTLALLLPYSTGAQNLFDPDFIISDDEMQDYRSLTRYDIQNFLDSKASYLRTHKDTGVDGKIKSATDIIYNASQSYKINPKYLLVTLQKEQSLITDNTPSQKQLDWATGYAVCDGCYLSDPKVLAHKGFAKQVDNSAGLIRWYYDNKNASFIKQKNKPTTIDGQRVVPESWATGFLYTYTPHLHGNKNFWTIWNDWFGQSFPNGTLVKTPDSEDIYLIQDGKRRKFKSKTALITRANPELVITIPEAEVKNYPLGIEISLPNYSILKQGTKYYLLDFDTLRPFASYGVVQKLGYNPQEILEVSSSDIRDYQTGKTISLETIAPQGIIYQINDKGNACYYLVKDGIAQPIVDKNIIRANYGNLPLEEHTFTELNKLEKNYTPAEYQNGTLIMIDGTDTMYVMEDGKKRHIPDETTFKAMGYKTTNLITISQLAAFTIPDGEAIYLRTSITDNNIYLLNREQKIENLFQTDLPGYLVAEYPSGFILAGKNIDTPRPMGSLTKLLTAYEALEHNFNEKRFTVYNEKKYGAYGNILKFVDGEKIRNRDLFNTMLVKSVNNTARMVAQSTYIDENKFINYINERLEVWGAENTEVVDVTGLDAQNVSTPRDLLAIFMKALTKTDIKDAIGQTDYSFTELYNKNDTPKHNLENTNELILTKNKSYKIIASKTGYTNEGGACLVMLIKDEAGKQYITISMGEDNYINRFVEPNKLANWTIEDSFNLDNK